MKNPKQPNLPFWNLDVQEHAPKAHRGFKQIASPTCASCKYFQKIGNRVLGLKHHGYTWGCKKMKIVTDSHLLPCRGRKYKAIL